MKKLYFSTFVPGLERPVEAMLRKEGGVAVEHVLPGAAGAACAWVIFSELYSWYVNHIARASALYGSLSVLLLMLLWLYACLSILFYGALLNHLLFDRPEPEERCACSDT